MTTARQLFNNLNMTREAEAKFNPDFEKAEKKILDGVLFKMFRVPGGSPEFKSSSPGRKIIFLEHGSSTLPEVGVPYRVEIVKDTNPEDPTRGKLIARIIGESEVGAPKSGGTSEADTPGPGEAPMAEKKKETEQKFPVPIEHSPDGKKLYIFDLELEMPDCAPELKQFVPPLEKFRYLCQDERTLEVLYKAAEAYKLKEPCLLEGEPATSKTSAVEYLAALLGQPYRRMNYNGQTDTSELIGKFVPNDGDARILFENLFQNPSSLSVESQKVLQEAQSQNRGLTKFESQKIASNEGLKISDWKWEDGFLTFCATKGCVFLNDELGFAEPQILGRGLSSLEKTPSIEVSENGGMVIRKLTEEEEVLWPQGKLPGIVPLHPNFRQYGATNPAETHTGRVAFEPAYKDRWLAYKFIHPPTKEEYSQMLELNVYGRQPVVNFQGDRYQAEAQDPLYPGLAEIPNFSGFLEKLAKFHATLEEMARKREIGMSKKDKYIFTRRTLIEFLDYLEHKRIVVDREAGEHYSVKDMPKEIILRAWQYYYLDKISDPDDLKKVMDQLDVVGLSSSNWTHKFEEEAAKKPPAAPDSKRAPDSKAEPETVPKKEFLNVEGTLIRIGERAVLEDLRVGDQVRARSNKFVRTEVQNAKKIIIVGFTDKGKVVVQLDDDRVVDDSLEGHRRLYEKISSGSANPQTPENRTGKKFTTIAGNEVEVSALASIEGPGYRYYKGDRLIFIEQAGPSELKNAKDLVVVGFTLKGDVIVQIDGGRCLVDSPSVIKGRFSKQRF